MRCQLQDLGLVDRPLVLQGMDRSSLEGEDLL
jgi:hypothetical protein